MVLWPALLRRVEVVLLHRQALLEKRNWPSIWAEVVLLHRQALLEKRNWPSIWEENCIFSSGPAQSPGKLAAAAPEERAPQNPPMGGAIFLVGGFEQHLRGLGST